MAATISEITHLPGLSLVLPAYNEETSLRSSVQSALAQLPRFADRFEILIINDGSTDRTGELGETMAREDSRVSVYHNPINLNVGASVLIGLSLAKHEFVLHNGMDLPFHYEDLGKMTEQIRDADIVVAVRRDLRAHPPWNRMMSRVHHALVRGLFATRIRDLNFVQLYRRGVLKQITVKARSPAFVTAELLLRAERANFRIRQVEVPFWKREAGVSKFGHWYPIAWTLIDMMRYRLGG